MVLDGVAPASERTGSAFVQPIDRHVTTVLRERQSVNTTATSARSRILSALALIALCGAVVARVLTPPAPRPASAPLTEFSADRAMRHVRAIAQRPHPIGSDELTRVRAYLLGELAALRLAPDSQDVTAVGTRYQELGHVRNIVARLPGTSPDGPAIMLMSHYDGVPAGPAASDAGSGVSVILEVLRALRSGAPLTHDVIVVLTDGEEAGLLGAAAFVREHPWAKRVAVTLNFEARGTTGRAAMFETGPGNLDLVRILRRAPDVSASSLTVTVYRRLNNDTDLSEVSLLGKPALNFAFADGVERYHTTQDDATHINPGSMQQEGSQALSVVRDVGMGPLPRPISSDGVFSDLPLVGVVAYPESWARPLIVLITLLFLVAVWRLRSTETHGIRDLAAGVALTLIAVALSSGATFSAAALIARMHTSIGGNAEFSGVYALALALLAIAVTCGCWAFVRRWTHTPGLHHGALLVWLVLGFGLSFTVPGASFLFVWPLPLVILSALWQSESRVVNGISFWAATGMAVAVVAAVTAMICVVMIGIIGPGSIAMGALVALLCCLLLPHFELLAAARRARLASGLMAVSALVFGYARATVHASALHPERSALVYAIDVDSTVKGAWLVTPEGFLQAGTWASRALDAAGTSRKTADTAQADTIPEWLGGRRGRRVDLAHRRVPRVEIAGPTATVISDSLTPQGRQLVFRVVTPHGALNTRVRATDVKVLAASVDGRAIDTTRYRTQLPMWTVQFAAPPDSGFVLALTFPRGSIPHFDLRAEFAGLPMLPGITMPPRPDDTVPSQSGDVTVVHRRVAF